jgi:hypothetical protein
MYHQKFYDVTENLYRNSSSIKNITMTLKMYLDTDE